MRKRILVPCLATLFVSGAVVAQTIPGAPLQRTGQAIDRGVDAVQGTVREGVNRVENGARATVQRTQEAGEQLANPSVNNRNGSAERAENNGNVSNGRVNNGSEYNRHAYNGYANGAMNQHASSGRTYRLMHDHSGREFICVNGQRVYFDNPQPQQMQPNGERYEAGYRGNDNEGSSKSRAGSQGQPLNRDSLGDQPALNDLTPNSQTDGNAATSGTAGAAAGAAGATANGNAAIETGAADGSLEVNGSANASGAAELPNGDEAEAGIKSEVQADAAAELPSDTTLKSPSPVDAGSVESSLDAGTEAVLDGNLSTE